MCCTQKHVISEAELTRYVRPLPVVQCRLGISTNRFFYFCTFYTFHSFCPKQHKWKFKWKWKRFTTPMCFWWNLGLYMCTSVNPCLYTVWTICVCVVMYSSRALPFAMRMVFSLTCPYSGNDSADFNDICGNSGHGLSKNRLNVGREIPKRLWLTLFLFSGLFLSQHILYCIKPSISDCTFLLLLYNPLYKQCAGTYFVSITFKKMFICTLTSFTLSYKQ